MDKHFSGAIAHSDRGGILKGGCENPLLCASLLRLRGKTLLFNAFLALFMHGFKQIHTGMVPN
jgi:hypothetical protein